MLNRFVKSEFGKNVVTLMTGTTIAQILPVALTPVLTRLFSPEEFGAFAFFASIISILLVFSSGRYEQAIVLPKEDKDAINILGLCFSLLGPFLLPCWWAGMRGKRGGSPGTLTTQSFLNHF